MPPEDYKPVGLEQARKVDFVIFPAADESAEVGEGTDSVV